MRLMHQPAAKAVGSSGLLLYETGYYIKGPFQHYFQTHGGVQFFGYPFSPATPLGRTSNRATLRASHTNLESVVAIRRFRASGASGPYNLR